MKSERTYLIDELLTEHYLLYLDGEEVEGMTSGCWANLSSILDAAEKRLNKKLPRGRKIVNRYINTDKNRIMFWTYQDNTWFTL